MARHHAGRAPPGGRLTRGAIIALGAALALSGCGIREGSRCAAPRTAPVPLSGDRRSDPVVAANGVGVAAAAWRTTTGDPVEVRVRESDGRWRRTRAIGGRNARDPAVAVTPDGTALVVVQAYSADRRSSITAYGSGDDFAGGVIVSDRSAGARRPQLGVDARGTATAMWVRDVGVDSGVVQTATRDRSGRWTAPTPISAEGRVDRTALAVAPDGSAVAAWEEGSGSRKRVLATLRSAGGRWQPPRELSQEPWYASEPAVAAQNHGQALAVWIEDRGGQGVAVRAATVADGRWHPPRTLDTGDAPALEMPRPGRAWLGPAAAIAPDGRAVAAWPRTRAGVTQIRSALSDGDRWGNPLALSSGADQSGGVSVAIGPGGRPLAGWEEIDHGLLRARVTADDPERCVDLSPADGETAGVRLAGGARPAAVFVNLNRGRIMAVELP